MSNFTKITCEHSVPLKRVLLTVDSSHAKSHCRQPSHTYTHLTSQTLPPVKSPIPLL